MPADIYYFDGHMHEAREAGGGWRGREGQNYMPNASPSKKGKDAVDLVFRNETIVSSNKQNFVNFNRKAMNTAPVFKSSLIIHKPIDLSTGR